MTTPHRKALQKLWRASRAETGMKWRRWQEVMAEPVSEIIAAERKLIADIIADMVRDRVSRLGDYEDYAWEADRLAKSIEDGDR